MVMQTREKPTTASLAIAMKEDLIDFVTSHKIVDSVGNVYSWFNQDHPGFIYPEAMGLYLNLASQMGCYKNNFALTHVAHTVGKKLQEYVPSSGGIGKYGKIYAFDTSMAISGLLAYKKYLHGWVDDATIRQMASFIVEMTRHRLTVINDDKSRVNLPPHWSTRFGASTLKTVIALDALALEFNDKTYHHLLVEVANEILENCFSHGCFSVHEEDSAVYCHAHCYALEGLIYLQKQHDFNVMNVLLAGADRLKMWQNSDGSLFNWYNAPDREQLKMSDATAQAVRIWLAVDRDFYHREIERGLEFLASLCSPQSGIYYHQGSQDLNSWAALFTIQATDWYLNGVQLESIV
jgi:hypothetical protein